MNKTTLQWDEISDTIGSGGNGRSITISEDVADMTIDDFIDIMVIPLLKAIGYHEDFIKEALGYDS